MANEYDPYREALVVEQRTLWPSDYDGWEESQKQRVAQRLHAQPGDAAELEYVRQHSGFTRQITVTPADVERVG